VPFHRSREAPAGSMPPGCAVGFRWTIFSSHFPFVPLVDSSEQRERGNMLFHRSSLMVTAFHSASSCKDFLFGGEPNEVSVSLLGSNALALAAGGIFHSSDKRIKTEFSVSFVQYSIHISFISALLKFFPFSFLSLDFSGRIDYIGFQCYDFSINLNL
jgi:hypothetical protein